MDQITLKPIAKQVFQVAPEQSHPRLSLRRVLYVKFLRWVEAAPLSSLIKAILNCLMLLLFCLAVVAPQFVLGMAVAVAKWDTTPRVAAFFAVLLLTLNAKRLYRLVKRAHALKEKKGNQYTYEGIPLDSFVTYLFEKQAFTTDAMKDLALSQRKWARIADALENGDILRRGENNSRVLNPDATREIVVRQLRDGFPMTFDLVGNVWAEKRGKYDTWCLRKDREEQKEKEKVEKLERKEDRMRKNIARMREQQSVFQSIMAPDAV